MLRIPQEFVKTARDKRDNDRKVVLEAQWRNVKERPQAKQVGILLDAGPEKMLSLLDKFLADEAKEGVQ